MRVRLIHWNQAEAEARVAELKAAGFTADFLSQDGASTLTTLRADPPQAVVIDLSRLPSHGRQVALALRATKSTRNIPLIFAGGDPAKVARIREQLPDATYADASNLAASIRAAIEHPPAQPVVPPSSIAAPSSKPLAAKLNFKPGTIAALLNPPRGFERLLDPLPTGAGLTESTAGASLVFCFVESQAELNEQLAALRALPVPLWILWRKGQKPAALTPLTIRAAANAYELTDYKICAVDRTWSGMLLGRRRT